MKLDMNIDEYLPLREVVFHTLRKAIIQGELQPGERLMEVTLANKLGVSRTPVREAIRMLELEGLVVMIPRKGAEVAKITVRDLKMPWRFEWQLIHCRSSLPASGWMRMIRQR